MNKPITMVVKETRTKLINICNESGLSPAILDLIMQNLYSEIHNLAERQAAEEEMTYARMIEEESKKADKKTEVADKDVE